MLRVEQRRCFVLQTFVYVVVVVVMVAYILLTVASLVWFVVGQQEPANRIKLPVLLLGLILATCLLGRVPHTHSIYLDIVSYKFQTLINYWNRFSDCLVSARSTQR